MADLDFTSEEILERPSPNAEQAPGVLSRRGPFVIMCGLFPRQSHRKAGVHLRSGKERAPLLS